MFLDTLVITAFPHGEDETPLAAARGLSLDVLRPALRGEVEDDAVPLQLALHLRSDATARLSARAEAECQVIFLCAICPRGPKVCYFPCIASRNNWAHLPGLAVLVRAVHDHVGANEGDLA